MDNPSGRLTRWARELSQGDFTIKYNKIRHPEYTVRDGRLYCHILHTLDFNDTGPGDQWKVCIPRAEQANILRGAHDEPTLGHLQT